MTDRAYWVTTFTVEVLSEGPEPPEFDSLADVHERVTNGDMSGWTSPEVYREVGAVEMAHLLLAQGSDPAFLIDEETLSHIITPEAAHQACASAVERAFNAYEREGAWASPLALRAIVDRLCLQAEELPRDSAWGVRAGYIALADKAVRDEHDPDARNVLNRVGAALTRVRLSTQEARDA